MQKGKKFLNLCFNFFFTEQRLKREHLQNILFLKLKLKREKKLIKKKFTKKNQIELQNFSSSANMEKTFNRS